MPDLRHISTALKQYGRQGDDQLVHMSSKEVAALNAISPNGLTRNPHTGLPEAFSLTDVLGPIAGIATAIFAPELLPFVAGAAGIGTAIGTGDIGKGIMAGLGSYGLGSLAGAAAGALGVTGASIFGGADAAGALGEAAGGGDFVGAGLGPTGITAGTDGTIGMAGSGALGSGAGASGYSQLAGDFGGGAATAAGSPQAALAASQASEAAGGSGITPAMVHANSITPTIGNIDTSLPSISAGDAGAGGMMGWIKNNPMAVTGGLMALNAISPNGSGNYPSSALNQPKGPSTPLVNGPVARDATMPLNHTPGGPEANYFPAAGDPSAALSMTSPVYAQQAQALNALQSPTQSLMQASSGLGGLGSAQQQALQSLQQRQQMGMKAGGAVPPSTTIWPSIVGAKPQIMPVRSIGTRRMADGGEVPPDGGDPSGMDPAMVQNLIQEAKAAMMGQADHPEEILERFQDIFGPDALNQLAASVKGASGAVQGAGDGVADMAPGTIDGTQPVRLATDEHVVPADVVSHLGNGSSAQGHRLLKEMTTRVRQAKTGKAGMPKRVNPQGYMPG